MSDFFTVWAIVDGGAPRDIEVQQGDLGRQLEHLPKPVGPIAIDTETSGLRVDSGARVVAVSWAYRHAAGTVSYAVPFDMGWDLTKTQPDGRELPHHRTCNLHATKERARLKKLETALGQYTRAKTARTQATAADKMRALEFAPACSCPVTINASEADWRALGSWLWYASMAVGWVGQNSPFDARMMAAGTRHYSGIDLPDFAWDTMLAQAVMEPTESTSLKVTASRLWGDDQAEEQRVLKEAMKLNPPGWAKRFDLPDWSVVGPYAAMDTELTLKLYEHQQHRLDTDQCWPDDRRVIELEVAMSNVLTKIMSRGLLLDVEGLKAEGARVLAEADRLAAELPFPATPAGASDFFFPGGVGAIKTSDKTGKASVDRDVVAELQKTGEPWADEYQRVMALRSLASKFYTAWSELVGPDGRLRTTFKQVMMETDSRSGSQAGGTVSGRLSSAEPNLQQLPDSKRIRVQGVTGPKKFFRAKPGHVLFEADVSGAEARILCWYGQIESMRRDVFVAGENIHDINTRKIFGIQPDHPDWDRLRHLAKTGLFSIVYGAGVRKLAESLKISEAECREFRSGVFRAYPEIKRLMRQCEARVDGGRPLVLAGGRRRPHGWNEFSFKAANSLIQGSQAMALRPVIIEIERRFPGQLVSTVHDSVWLESPADSWQSIGAEVQSIIKETFEGYFSSPEFYLPFSSDLKLMATDSEGFG